MFLISECYDSFYIFISFAMGLLFSIGLGAIVILELKKLKLGQVVREEGVQAHIAKAGTPTMGGVLFLLSMILGFAVLAFYTSFRIVNENTLFLLFSTVGFGIIGFLDDYLKVVRNNTDGLKPKQKLLGILLVSLGLYFLIPQDVKLYLPFIDLLLYKTSLVGYAVHIPSSYLLPGVLGFAIFFPMVYILSSATVNAVNLTDGIDGLCASVSSVVSLFFVVLIFILQNEYSDVMLLNLLFLGALIGYLFYNWYPAKVMMGDVGSFAIGGFILANSILLNLIWWLPIFGFIYVWETLSVIIQVMYYKRTKKRIFKMSPFHHHLELCGWKEVKIVIVFSLVTFLLCASVLFLNILLTGMFMQQIMGG